jgi:hypothetical protein
LGEQTNVVRDVVFTKDTKIMPSPAVIEQEDENFVGDNNDV